MVTTAVNLASRQRDAGEVYPVLNSQFIVGATTYTVNVPVAYQNAAGPYWPMVNGRFIVPGTAPVSSLAYTVDGSNVVKGYVISNDDEFSADGNTVYTVNAVNVVKATNQATLGGPGTPQSLTAGALTYSLDATTSLATIQPAGLNYNTTTSSSRSPTMGSTSLTPSLAALRSPTTAILRLPSRPPLRAPNCPLPTQSTASSFSFDDSGNNPITVGFPYSNQFFIDLITGVTYYVDEHDNRVEVLSYLPETTQYAFVPRTATPISSTTAMSTLSFPVIAGANVNAGVATVAPTPSPLMSTRSIRPAAARAVPINSNSFEVNGNLYTISGTPTGADYSPATSSAMPWRPSLPFRQHLQAHRSDRYLLAPTRREQSAHLHHRYLRRLAEQQHHLGQRRRLRHHLQHRQHRLASWPGTGLDRHHRLEPSISPTHSIPRSASSPSPISTSMTRLGGRPVHRVPSPTFFIGSAIYTLDPVNLAVTDNNKRPYPLLPNPTMFSINGYNYVIDSNRTPHAIVGNNNVSPLSTDVTVQSGMPIPNSTFTLNGQIYAYVEELPESADGYRDQELHDRAAGLTFKLDSSLVFTLSRRRPRAGTTPDPLRPSARSRPRRPRHPHHPQRLCGRASIRQRRLLPLQKRYVHPGQIRGRLCLRAEVLRGLRRQPQPNQQQLAIFNLNGNTYMVTDGTTAGVPRPPESIPATCGRPLRSPPWKHNSAWSTDSPRSHQRHAIWPGVFQFMVTDTTGLTTLYDILYTPGSNANVVKVDVPTLLPTFMQTGPFTFVPSAPLTFQTGGYNAFTTFVAETVMPSESFAASYKTPVVSSSPLVDTLLGPQGDFSLEFWHSLPLSPPSSYHPFTYSASTNSPLVYYR